MTLKDILQAKGTTVHTIEPTATLADVIQQLVHHNVGSLLVMQDGAMAGIITERDILRACAAGCGELQTCRVADYMTQPVVTALPSDLVANVMGLMTHHRIRHLPVVSEGQLVGVVSIGDIVKSQHDALCVENHYLKNYIQS